MINQMLEDIKESIISVIENYPINKAAIFGSYANGLYNEESDIDILVNFTAPIGMFKFLDLKDTLEMKLNRKVDLLTYKSLENSYIKEEVLKGVVEIYAKG